MGIIKAVVWDIIGVYFNDARAKVLTNLANATNIPYTRVRDVLVGERSERSVLNKELKTGRVSFEDYKQAAKRLGVDITGLDLENLWFSEYKPREGIEELVKEVKDKGRINVSLSNNFPELVDYLDDKYGFKRHFSARIWSYDVGYTKPSNEIYDAMFEAIKKHGVQGYQCAFIDDQKKNQTAYVEDRLNMSTILVDKKDDKGAERVIREKLREFGVKVKKA